MSDDRIGENEFPTVLNELADLPIGKTKELVVQLGVPLSVCDDVDYRPVEERRLKLLGGWLKTSENTTWSLLVNALNTPVVKEHELAENIRAKYCPSVAQYRPKDKVQLQPLERPVLHRTRGTTISGDDELRSSCEFSVKHSE